MKGRLFLKWTIIFSVGLFLLLGCGGKSKSVKTIQGDPEILYKQGLALFNKRDYADALKKFEELKSNFPDSPPYTVWAELKIGDAHFLHKGYVEAIAAYEEFKKIHPTHEEIQYVQYQIAMAYFSQMLTLDRDQTSTTKALSNFEYLVANYPPNLFTGKAKEKIETCRKRLADHEFYIGNFYYNQGRYRAAASRFEGLLDKFPKVSEEDKTLFFLGKSYLEFDQAEKTREAFTKIIVQYPKSSYYKEAKAFLDHGVKEKKVSLRKGKEKEVEKKEEPKEAELSRVALVKFEEEGKQPVSLKEEKKARLEKAEERVAIPPGTGESVNPTPPKEWKEMTPSLEPIQESRIQAIPLPAGGNNVEPILSGEPMKEDRTVVSPSHSSNTRTPEVEVKPDDEKRIAALPSLPTSSKEEEKVKKGSPPEMKEATLVDKSQPIDITSDKVQAYSKDNLIVFQGNVTARQKDIVIYADSLEAVVVEGGKGLEKAIAGGNVRIQMGLRVANCQRAVFYNLDQKVVLTGDPKVVEGDNVVSGEEITYDIEQNRLDVKGGPTTRGKATIHFEEESEKKK
jgi:outer membrane protein assembly factor BamD